MPKEISAIKNCELLAKALLSHISVICKRFIFSKQHWTKYIGLKIPEKANFAMTREWGAYANEAIIVKKKHKCCLSLW